LSDLADQFEEHFQDNKRSRAKHPRVRFTEGQIAKLKESFETGSFGTSTRALSKLAKINRDRVQDARKALAQLIVEGRTSILEDMASTCKSAVKWRGVIPLLAGKLRAWDETQHYIALRSAEDSTMVQRYWPVMHALLTFLLVLEIPNGENLLEHVIVIGDLPTQLVALQKQTGELLAAGLGRISELCDLDELFDGFRDRIQMGCTDRAGANTRVSADSEVTHEGWAEFLLGCQAHDSHHCVDETLSLRWRLLPRVAKACASLQMGGLIVELRDLLAKMFEEHVVRVTGTSLGEEAEAYRMAHINHWWPKVPEGTRMTASLRKRLLRRLVMKRLPNHDWKAAFDELLQIVHYCEGPQCCESETHTKEQFHTYVLPSVLPYAAVRVSQHKWSSEDTQPCVKNVLSRANVDCPTFQGWPPHTESVFR
jgi:hypothetical protein